MSYNYKGFSFNHSRLVLCEKREYSRTESGKSWKSKPDSVKHSVENGQWFENFVRSVPWFNNRYYGESCRCEWGYTKAGFVPLQCVTSKTGYKKIVYEFHFISSYQAKRLASPEQHQTMIDCDDWQMACSNKYGRCFRFSRTDSLGNQHSAIWKDSQEAWV